MVREESAFGLNAVDAVAFASYFVGLCLVGWWSGRRSQQGSQDYFLAGRTLPWYVVGSSFVASNISSEHFIGMIGAACVFGIAPAFFEWGNLTVFSLLIWLFIPFLLASKVFTIPEYMEARFNPFLRQFFAVVTVISNVVAFLAAVLYGGGLALQSLFGWDLWFSIVALGVVAGSWAIYGGLRSVAWTDFFTLVIMLIGGLLVTVLGLYDVAGPGGSLWDGVKTTVACNQAETGKWAEAVTRTAPNIVGRAEYNRLSVIQPVTHTLVPWPSLILAVFYLSIWYSVCNQFMIQRVLGARDAYHARMGIVLAGYMKAFLPLIIVLPGLILFARNPEILLLPWEQVKPEADKGYVRLLQTLVPAGLRGLFLAALFGAIQSTVNSVLNSTSTIVTLDLYKRLCNRDADERTLVIVGMASATGILVISMILAGYINRLGGGLFEYIQALYAFFAPPFGSVFLLGILFRRINARGATAGVLVGFGLGILLKFLLQWTGGQPAWLAPFAMQGILNWLASTVVCVVVSLVTAPPAPQQVSENLVFHWRSLNLWDGLGSHWYNSVLLWWGGFFVLILALFTVFSGMFW